MCACVLSKPRRVRKRTRRYIPTNKPTNQPTIEPTNQPTIEPTNQPTNQPFNQPTNQPTNHQPFNQPTNQLWLILVSWTTSRPYSWKFSQQRRKLLPISTAFSTLKLVHLNLGISRETTVNHETKQNSGWISYPKQKSPRWFFSTGQVIIFHQPRFPWNNRWFPKTQTLHFFCPGCANLAKKDAKTKRVLASLTILQVVRELMLVGGVNPSEKY